MKKIVAILFLCLFISKINGQNAPFAIPYQAIARNTGGVILPSQNIQIKLGVYAGSSSGILEWEETHLASTDVLGLFKISIGQGTSTGNGVLSSFSLVNWSAAIHFVKIQIDYSGGSSFMDMGSSQLLSVPYAFFSNSSNAASGVSINDLIDVDTAGHQNGYMLKWTGTQWRPFKDNDRDTVMFVDNTNHSTSSDTSNFAVTSLMSQDSVLFAYQSDTSSFSTNTQNAGNAVNGSHSDTATYASSFVPYNWSITGNVGNVTNNTLGTKDSVDLIFKTNNTENIRVLANGKMGLGTISPMAQFEIKGVDGIMHVGTFGSGDTLLTNSSGTKMMWYSRRAAFRLGSVTGNQWRHFNIADYSFGVGRNPYVSGLYSVAFGDSSSVYCMASVAMGRKCYVAVLSGVDDGGSLAMGDSCTVIYTRSVAMGYHSFSDGGYSFGYKNKTTGGTSFALGCHNIINSGSSMLFGSNASSNGKLGVLVYSDSSSSISTIPLADNQFVVRASGGVNFYSDSTLTNGVVLFAGSGSWSSVSDRNKKENFYDADGEDILNKLSRIKVTEWNYKSQPLSIKHIGPMAQDFYHEFKLGESRRKINTVDIDGVNLLAIKALNAKLNLLETSINNVKQVRVEASNVDEEMNSIENRLNAIQKTIKNK